VRGVVIAVSLWRHGEDSILLQVGLGILIPVEVDIVDMRGMVMLVIGVLRI
jgi:hypothetical protein